MRDPLRRGSAPERARDKHDKSFKKGHKKLGGRKRGTPNLVSADQRKALLEAMYRIGYDGNGKDGCLGYLRWVAETDRTFFYCNIWIRLLELEEVDGPTPVRQPQTPEQRDCAERKLIGLSDHRSGPVAARTRAADDWTGQPSPVGGLMRLAVENHRVFCTNFLAACLPGPNKKRRRRRPDANGAPGTPNYAMEVASAIEESANSI